MKNKKSTKLVIALAAIVVLALTVYTLLCFGFRKNVTETLLSWGRGEFRNSINMEIKLRTETGHEEQVRYRFRITPDEEMVCEQYDPEQAAWNEAEVIGEVDAFLRETLSGVMPIYPVYRVRVTGKGRGTAKNHARFPVRYEDDPETGLRVELTMKEKMTYSLIDGSLKENAVTTITFWQEQ